MIYIQPYIDKLEALREYINMVIAGVPPLNINLEAFPKTFTPDDILRMYAEAGVMFYSYPVETGVVKKLNFTEWYESKRNNIKP